MKVKFSKFEVSDYLNDDEIISEYLMLTLKKNDPELILSALSDIAKAKGMSKIAEKSGLGRESMYKALRPGAKPRFETIMKIIHALGFTLQVQSPSPKAVADEKPEYKTRDL